MMRKLFRRRYVLGAIGIAAAACLGAEAIARLAGVGDFPLFANKASSEYIMVPNQRGAFLNRLHWEFNERSMAVGRPFKPTSDGILLIGDSIVSGGTGIDQADRLGSNIERETGCPVWPIGTGGWALSNELAELLANRDFLELPTIVFISNSVDFERASVWVNEYAHPTHRPWSVALYALRKKLWPPDENVPIPVEPGAETKWHAQLGEFLSVYRGRIVWIFYPTNEELKATVPAFAELQRRITGKATIVEPASDPRWNASLYRDLIHPNAEGNRVLGKIIAERLPRCRQP